MILKYPLNPLNQKIKILSVFKDAVYSNTVIKKKLFDCL